jgi:hypothetical protein
MYIYVSMIHNIHMYTYNNKGIIIYNIILYVLSQLPKLNKILNYMMYQIYF